VRYFFAKLHLSRYARLDDIPHRCGEAERMGRYGNRSGRLYDAEEIVALVAQTIRKTIKYEQREAKGVQSPSLTLSAGSGSRRDMATLMLEALRSVGLPARFASGYLECTASEAGRASTHAWLKRIYPT
jgi:transglutaminase-like putative cysteine protease